MTSLYAFLAAAVGPLAIRVLTALGFAAVSFAGVQTAFNGLLSSAQSSWSAVSGDVLALASLAGVPEALGLIAGAMSARVGLWVAASSMRLIIPAS